MTLTALAALLMIPGCGGGGADRIELPARAGGWALDGETEYFGSDALFDHINGGAEVYLEKGFRELAVGHYVLDEGVEVMAEVYAMETPAAASEMFDLEQGERASGSVGEEAAVATQSMAFRRGPYYVKLIAYSPEDGLQSKLEELGAAIDTRLSGA